MIKQFLRLFPYVRQLEDQLQKALCGEISLESLQVKDGNIDLKLKSKIVPIVAGAFHELLDEMQAPNYIEFSLDHLETHETILVIVQKKSGKSPHELRVEAEEKYKALLEGNPEATKLSEIPCWYVSYRGNCFGIFMTENLAEEFSEFIKPKIDAKASVNCKDWIPAIHESNVKDCLNRAFPTTYFEDVV
jgi:hypothetical protein